MGVLDLIFPISCLGCGKEGEYLCRQCLLKVEKARLFCLECHRFSINGAVHTNCRKKLSIDFAFSLWDYDGVVRSAIIKLKYNFAYKVAEELAEKFAERLKIDTHSLPDNAILIPIPLYKSRKNWRGFNQAEIMGKIVAKKMDWQFATDLLIRRKKTSPQAELKGKERRKNMFNAFMLAKEHRFEDVPYILFDDVLTTGSTIKEAAKVFKKGGVKTVLGLTIAA